LPVITICSGCGNWIKSRQALDPIGSDQREPMRLMAGRSAKLKRDIGAAIFAIPVTEKLSKVTSYSKTIE